MYAHLSKKFIEKLMPYLSQINIGQSPKVSLWKIVKVIIYRLKIMERITDSFFLR